MRFRASFALIIAIAVLGSRPAVGETPAAPPFISDPAGSKVDDVPWQTDASGRRFHVEKLAKSDGAYERISQREVRTSLGMRLELLREDADTYYVKIYQPEPAGPGLVRPAPKPLGGAAAPEAPPVSAPAQVPAAGPGPRPIRLESFGEGLPTGGQWRNGFDLGDMNGDGHLDIVHGAPRKGSPVPVIYLGDGKGHWQRWSTAVFPHERLDYGAVAVADFNGDKVLDMALGIHLSGMLILTGDGKGGFTSWSEGVALQRTSADPPAFSSRAVTTVDWNSDGKPDVVALGEGPRPSGGAAAEGLAASSPSFGPVLLINEGSGSWTVQRQQQALQGFGDSIAVGDFNGDKRPDLAAGSSWLGRRDLVQLGQRDGGLTMVSLDALPARLYAWSVAVSDWDGNGLDDVAVGSTSIDGEQWQSGVDLSLAQQDGTWRHVVVARVPGRRGVFALAGGDLDGDHSKDLVALTGEGEVWVFTGDGHGRFSSRDTSNLAPGVRGCRGYHARLADLDADGSDEVIAAFAGEPERDGNVTNCESGGAILAWKYEAAPVVVPAAASKPAR